MHAKLYLVGEQHTIYLLFDDNGTSEVERLLTHEHRSPRKRGVQATFLKRAEHAADNGFRGLPKEWRDCWPETNPDGQFCELKAKDHRISFFYYPGGRVLFATWFTKSKMKEKKSYARAIRLNNRFQENPTWIGEG